VRLHAHDAGCFECLLRIAGLDDILLWPSGKLPLRDAMGKHVPDRRIDVLPFEDDRIEMVAVLVRRKYNDGRN